MTSINTEPFSDATSAANHLLQLIEVTYDEQQAHPTGTEPNERIDALLWIARDLARSLAKAVEANEVAVLGARTGGVAS